jgi:hypothetical protein
MSERKWLGKVDRDGCMTFRDILGKACIAISYDDCRQVEISPCEGWHITLSRPMVKALIRHLERWLETGRLR